MNINTIIKPYDINLNINNDTIFYFLMLIVHRKLCIINKEDIKNRYLLLNYFKNALNTNEDTINYTSNYKFNSKYYKFNSKYYIFKEKLLKCRLLKKEDHDYIIFLFNKTQKIYFSLLKYIKSYKRKNYVIYEFDTDLRFNNLDIYDKKRIVKIYENNTIYSFYIFDLLKYWKSGLLNSDYLYEEPILLKNPYTNIEMKKINLYKI